MKRRFDIRLRSNKSDESALIEALEKQSAIYGGKGELLRECLNRGFMAFKQNIADANSRDDEAIISALIQSDVMYGLNYRVAKNYLEACRRLTQPESATTAVRAPAADTPAHGDTESVKPMPVPQTSTEKTSVKRPDWGRMRELAGSSGERES